MTAWRGHVVIRQALDGAPKGEQPSFEFVLGGVRVEPGVPANPLTHFPLRVLGILEVPRPSVDVRKRNHGVGWRLPTSQQAPYLAFYALACRDAAVLRHRIKTRHAAGEPRFQEAPQVTEKSPFGLPFDQDGNLHARPPIRPIRQTSSKVYSASQSSKSNWSAQVS